MEFYFRNSPCQLHCISRVDAEEDDRDFRLLDPAVYPLETVMFLLRSKGSFHCCGSYTGKFFLDRANRRAPSLNALNESFSMNDRPSTMMLLHLAPNSTFFTSLPRTIGRAYGNFATDLSLWYRVSQAESDGHLTQRKEGMKASEFTLFERFFIIFIKIELCERKTWCYFRNLLYLCHDDFFSFPPKQAQQSSLGDFLLSYAKIQKNITLAIKSLGLF